MNRVISKRVLENNYIKDSFAPLMKVSKHGVNETKQKYLYSGLALINNLVFESYKHRHDIGTGLCFSDRFLEYHFSHTIRKQASKGESWFNKFAVKSHYFSRNGVGKTYADIWSLTTEFINAIVDVKKQVELKGYEHTELLHNETDILKYRKKPVKPFKQPQNTINIPFKLNNFSSDVNFLIAKNADYIEEGYLNQYYRRGDTERLWGEGFSLQFMKKSLRNQFCKGYWSYDIEASAPNILSQLNVKTTNDNLRFLNEYRFNRAEVRRQIANDIFCRCDDVAIKFIKGLFNRLFFGGGVHPKDKEVIQKLMVSFNVSENSAVTIIYDIITHPLYKGIACDIRLVFNALNNKYGQSINYGDTKNEKIAYLYQSEERRVLDSMKEAVGDSLQLPLHDGIIIKDFIDPQKIESAIKKNTGYKLKLECEKVA